MSANSDHELNDDDELNDDNDDDDDESSEFDDFRIFSNPANFGVTSSEDRLFEKEVQ